MRHVLAMALVACPVVLGAQALPAPMPTKLPGSPTAVDKLNAAKVDSVIRYLKGRDSVVVVVPPTPDTATWGGVRLPALANIWMPTLAERPSFGTTVRVTTRDQLQAALDNVVCGTNIVVPAGTTITGAVRYGRLCRNDAYLTLRTETLSGVPKEGDRLTPAQASSAPKLVMGTAEPAITFANGSGYFNLLGIEVVCFPGYMNACVFGGDKTVGGAMPTHIAIDRSAIRGQSATDLGRCVNLNATYVLVSGSLLTGCHGKGRDAQAFLAMWGAGPITLINNVLEGSGENVMIGGGDSPSAALLPGDIAVLLNTISKPVGWIGVWTVKNLFELKVGRRVIVEGNLLDGNWTDAQTGFGVIIKSSNQDNTAPWSSTSDVLFRYNELRSEQGFAWIGKDPGTLDSASRRVLMQHNRYVPQCPKPTDQGCGYRPMQILGIEDFTADRNTFLSTEPVAAVIFADRVAPNFTYTANANQSSGPYGWVASSAVGLGVGDDAIKGHTTNAIWRGNAHPGGTAASTPTQNGRAAISAVLGADTVELNRRLAIARSGVGAPIGSYVIAPMVVDTNPPRAAAAVRRGAAPTPARLPLCSGVTAIRPFRTLPACRTQ